MISFLTSKRLTGPLELKNSKKAYQLVVNQFMGYEANISKRERDGKTLHRVRIGPIDSLEDMNRIRTALSENKMETTVVRIPLTEPATGKAPAAAR